MGGKQGQTLAPLDETFQRLGGGAEGSLGDWRSWLRRPPRLCGDHPEPRARTAATAALRARRPADVGRGHAGHRRLRGRARRSGAGRQQLRVSDHGRPDWHRVPGGHPDRRHPADELPRAAPPLRSVRLCVRRQPRGRGARRHQHPPHGDADVHADGRVGRGERRDPDRSPQRGGDQPRGAERARRHRGRGHRRGIVCRRHRHDPGCSHLVPSSCSRCAPAWCC